MCLKRFNGFGEAFALHLNTSQPQHRRQMTRVGRGKLRVNRLGFFQPLKALSNLSPDVQRPPPHQPDIKWEVPVGVGDLRLRAKNLPDSLLRRFVISRRGPRPGNGQKERR